MKTFCSHTLVRQGMPFIGFVLKQVIPYANRCLVTISRKSDDGTLNVLTDLSREFPGKIHISYENVDKPADLTQERQKQVEETKEDWILFVDDDDLWERETIYKIVKIINTTKETAFCFNPYQVINKKYHDGSFRYRWFTKLFKNVPGLHYERPWPEDMIYVNDKILFHRKNKDVISRPDIKFFHLSNIKNHSFRNEKWAKKYKSEIDFKFKKKIPSRFNSFMEKIYSLL